MFFVRKTRTKSKKRQLDKKNQQKNLEKINKRTLKDDKTQKKNLKIF